LTGAGHHRVEWKIDPETMIAPALGFEVEIRPFLGVISMPPSIPGILLDSSAPADWRRTPVVFGDREALELLIIGSYR